MVNFGFPSADGGGDAAEGGGAAVDGFLGGLRSVRGGAILPKLSSRLMAGAQGAGGHWSFGIGFVRILSDHENLSLPCELSAPALRGGICEDEHGQDFRPSSSEDT